jgi:hypothetical protein
VPSPAGIDCRLGTDNIHFTWEGSDEMAHACGDGGADLAEDGTLTGEIPFHRGDDSAFPAAAGSLSAVRLKDRS